MLLEIIATTADEAVTASLHGADRVELISAFDQGGLSPNEDTIVAVVEALKRLEQSNSTPFPKTTPIHVMVRPHSQSFVYDEADLRDMIAYMGKARRLGIHAFVLGCLRPDGEIDTGALERLLEAAGDLPITFHRAFDEIADQEDALSTLMKYLQIKWLLTSGGKPSVIDAVDQIIRLNDQSYGHAITIMPGSGLTVASLPAFLAATKSQAVHLGTGVRNGGVTAPIDGALVRTARQILDQIR
ncbi:copper homeostasis protein CutC [Paenibacillus sp. LHD-38]|uniref:copper homeostasis protein CutC n=1 Tax=Paenibacillus sp. LHD-38 TaxID=3072143 RepID=UPI00280DB644|nr:copper homeostasis protein CutC [Paenibacillus sp. LHD-38]MDQ8735047.1 copper homeostasis protein CutC [Paenibacillus sp. LHD-38]